MRETKEDDTKSTGATGEAADRWAKANEKRAKHPNPTPKKTSKQRGNSNATHNRRPNNNNNNNKNRRPYNNNADPQEKASRELNQRMIQATNAKDLLLVLQKQKGALTSPSGGGKLNNVNFSTSKVEIF